MAPAFSKLLGTWLILLVLGALEFGASFLPLARAWRPLIVLPGILMIGVVVVNFMEVRKGPTIIRAFAAAAAFWLLILLVLGSADPLTRIDYRLQAGGVPNATINSAR
jgi:caa(3)-type oxidase subunit IV